MFSVICLFVEWLDKVKKLTILKEACCSVAHAQSACMCKEQEANIFGGDLIQSTPLF